MHSPTRYKIYDSSKSIAVVCGCARIYRWKEIYREKSGDVEKRSHSLSHFHMSHAMEFLDKIRKELHFLAKCLSPWIAMGRWDNPPYSIVRLITMAVIVTEEDDNNKALVYVKGCEKRKWWIATI